MTPLHLPNLCANTDHPVLCQSTTTLLPLTMAAICTSINVGIAGGVWTIINSV
jgi:hypothetical protein